MTMLENKRKYMRKYRQRPEVKTKEKEYRRKKKLRIIDEYLKKFNEGKINE